MRFFLVEFQSIFATSTVKVFFLCGLKFKQNKITSLITVVKRYIFHDPLLRGKENADMA